MFDPQNAVSLTVDVRQICQKRFKTYSRIM